MSKPRALPDLLPEIKFNLNAQEAFAKARGVVFEHWAATPSPIGLKDRGDYRRSDTLDVFSENGFIFKKVGEFVATLVNAPDSSQTGGPAEGGLYDNSTGRLILPKFYNKDCPSDTKEISILPGDRVYAKDLELVVDNYQRAEYNPTGSDFLQYPAKCVQTLIDSKGIEYTEGVQFKVNSEGNIQWIDGKSNPGIDPETGKGRVYSIRYGYKAFWYVTQLLNEIRITNTDTATEPTRMPQHVMVQREYVYHNKNRGDKANKTEKEIKAEVKDKKAKRPSRKVKEPRSKITENKPRLKVDMKDFE